MKLVKPEKKYFLFKALILNNLLLEGEGGWKGIVRVTGGGWGGKVNVKLSFY